MDINEQGVNGVLSGKWLYEYMCACVCVCRKTNARVYFVRHWLPTAIDVTWVGFPVAFMCLSVCFYTRYFKKNDVSRITRLDKEMFRHECWKPMMYFEVKGRGHTAHKALLAWVMALFWVLASTWYLQWSWLMATTVLWINAGWTSRKVVIRLQLQWTWHNTFRDTLTMPVCCGHTDTSWYSCCHRHHLTNLLVTFCIMSVLASFTWSYLYQLIQVMLRPRDPLLQAVLAWHLLLCCNFALSRVHSIEISMYVCLSVCFSVCSHISKTAQPNSTKFSVHVTGDCGSVVSCTRPTSSSWLRSQASVAMPTLMTCRSMVTRLQMDHPS